MPDGRFLRGPKEWKLLELTPPIRLLADYDGTAWRLRTILPSVPVSIPVIFNFCDPLRRIWSPSDLQQTPT